MSVSSILRSLPAIALALLLTGGLIAQEAGPGHDLTPPDQTGQRADVPEATPPAMATADNDIAAALDALAAGFMTTEQVPGAIAALVIGDAVILRGYGLVDLDAGTMASPQNARFEIGSISKLFTWLAAMMLVEEGALDLQADIAGYLIETKVPGSTPLTMAQLMSHRPGYEDSYAIFDPGIGARPRPQALNESAPDQVMPRGKITAYSNWGVALAGQVVEDIAGIRYEDFVQQRILDPLGMGDTTYSEASLRDDQPPLARSYRMQGGVAHPAFRLDIGSFGPAGSYASTATDMGRFLRFLIGDGGLEGERLLAPQTMAQMRTRLFDDRPESADMAHGFQSRPMFGTMAYGHAGGLNEFLSNLVFIPELQAGVFVSQNGGAGASLPFVLPDLILARLAADAGLKPPAPQPVADAAARAQAAAGRYMPNRRAFSGPTQLLGALEMISITALEDGAILAPQPILRTRQRYLPVAPDIWQDARGERIMLIRDDAGQPARLADGSGASTHERVTPATDPGLLAAAMGGGALFSLTTLLGLLWRRGLRGGSLRGLIAATVGLAGAVSVWAMLGAGLAMAMAAANLGSEFMLDQPQPTMEAFVALTHAVVTLAVLVLLSAGLAWRAPGWGLLRRLHYTVFALALAGLALMLVNWGLAFAGPL